MRSASTCSRWHLRFLQWPARDLIDSFQERAANMILTNRTVRARVITLAASVACTTFAVFGSTQLHAQTPPVSPEECRPGQIVDFCSSIPAGTPQGRAFLLEKGEYKTFQFPGAVITTVYDINNRGQMVG